LIYLVLYPGLGRFPGLLGWSAAGQHQREVDKANIAIQPLFAAYLKTDIQTLATDKTAMETGKRLYLTYCVQCHGADAKGAKGFPNLTDNDWLHGGKPEQITQTIAAGRMGIMPPHAHLGDETIKNLANYVRSLSGLRADAARVAKGKESFMAAGCSGCHGADAKGMQAIGSPNLTDKIWLYGSSEATIIETITQGRQNKMPAWQDFLGEGKVHLLAAYIYSLSPNSPHSAR
jgi:cytochrome c oxidase cbb3-type subunit 3